jgi:F-type H+-transporting ATPase subunit b
MHLLAFAESIQLFPDGTIFIHIALVLLMIWVLNRTFFRPVNRVIKAREKFSNIEGGEAAVIQSEAAEKETLYGRELLEVRSEGYSLLEKEHKKLVKARESRLAETRAEAEQKVSAEREEIERQAKDARAELGSQADKLADEIAATVLRS